MNHIPPERSETPDQSFSGALRRSIQASGLTLGKICAELNNLGTPLSASSLSQWSTGRRQPEGDRSLAALTSLERILAVRPGYLTQRLGTPRPRGRSLRVVPFADVMPVQDIVNAALAELGFQGTDAYPSELTVHESLTLNPAGVAKRIDFRHIVQARRRGTLRYPSVHLAEDIDPSAFQLDPRRLFEPVTGCDVGRVVWWPQHGLFGAELILGKRVEPGQTCVCDHTVHFPAGRVRAQHVTYSVSRRTRSLFLQATFEGELPERCEAYECPEDGAETRRELTIRRSVQALHHDAGPGMFGIQWDWGNNIAA